MKEEEKERTSLWKKYQGFRFDHARSGVPVTHPRGDAKLAVVHTHLELSGEVKAGDRNLGSNST